MNANTLPPAPVQAALGDLSASSAATALGLGRAELAAGLALIDSQLRQGAAAEAFRSACALVLCDPGVMAHQLALSHCALLNAEPELALQAASAAIVLAPADPRGYLASAKAYLALGHEAEAREDLQEAVRFDAKAGAAGREAQALLAGLGGS
ncbi:hypothetical protein NK718_13410 [Alsobacter sp. SYSU M60028]|uniref:Tetratricopeptide repeat protein n=1 Tax=Alsobacter ponti TaxID=2962936 RepID=A0ABT1LF38_9HYPH|nr:hypothetical protein [Alsobacter ponti]MCP8939518.1 hypothetical protein [Alsobacter ponti]